MPYRHEIRTRALNDRPSTPGRYVLYWMQASQRGKDNAALDVAVDRANDLGLPVLCVFGLATTYPEANIRHYAFMLSGLAEARTALADVGVKLAVVNGEPDEVAILHAKDAALVVCDAGYLRHQRAWRARVAAECRCSVLEVEGDVVVPVFAVSDKQEWSAATLRPKMHRILEACLAPARQVKPKRDSLGMTVPGDIPALDAAFVESLSVDRTVPVVNGVRGGGREAARLLADFVQKRLAFYDDERHDPSLGRASGLSPYLHFGQISPVRIARAIGDARGITEAAADAFREQLIVRRELAMNFVVHAGDYDAFTAVPRWARASLAAHARDARPYQYSRPVLEAGATHDPYWNAAMREMKATGRMHGYMRMYWGKKILEWSPSPAIAFRMALALNNKWFLDGRDPCSFAGVAWCFGLHDRPWTERHVFGMVRYMNAAGLEKKFDMESYLRSVDEAEKTGRVR